MTCAKQPAFSFASIHAICGRLATIWCVIGICLLGVILVDVALRLAFLAKDKWIDQPQEDARSLAWEFIDENASAWEAEYWREFQTIQMNWQSYVQWRRDPFQGKYINIDSRGVRQTWSNPQAQATPGRKRFRLFVFGGSTTWGTGVRDEFTIPSLLAKLLTAEGLPVEVTNFGESGYVTTQELLTLILQIQGGNLPDMVIFYDGINDVFATVQNRVAGKPQNEANRKAEFNLVGGNRLRSAYLSQLPSEFKGLHRLAHALNRRFGRQEHVNQKVLNSNSNDLTLARETVRIYESNLGLAESLGERYGFTCKFFWQPIAYSKDELTDAESGVIRLAPKMQEVWFETCRQLRQSPILARTEDFHDISAALDDVPVACYIDFAHLNEKANHIIAREMLVHVAPAIKRQIANPHQNRQK